MRKKLSDAERKRRKALSNKKYAAKNRDKLNKVQHEWRLKNPEKVKAAAKKYRLKNLEKTKQKRKMYYEKNKEREKLKTREYYQKVKNDPEFIKQNRKRMRDYYEKNREIIIKKSTARTTHRRRTNIKVRLTNVLRKRVWEALKNNRKSKRTMELIGCDVSRLMKHLESQFKPGMSWENYGAWHVDHIRPCASFDLSLEEHQNQCFHYSNLQPLWAAENLRKGYKYENMDE